MCRLFGFRSILKSKVHRSLIAAENSIALQSARHQDGWGLAYYINRIPHMVKSSKPANSDTIFTRVSGVVASETVLAHIRQATTGDSNTLNSHPFQHGNWVFAHNGQINDFPLHKQKLMRHIAPSLRHFVLGDTDSEVFFYLFISELTRRTSDIHRQGTNIQDVASALSSTVQLLQDICDKTLPSSPLDSISSSPSAAISSAASPAIMASCPTVPLSPTSTNFFDAYSDDTAMNIKMGKSMLTCIVTDGHSMLGLKMRKPLLYSTYKSKGCADRHSCSSYSTECENPTKSGLVNHFILASEMLQGENTWIDVRDGDIIGVDWRMVLHRGSMESEGVMTQVGRTTPPNNML